MWGGLGFFFFSILSLIALNYDTVVVQVEAANGLLPPADPPLIRHYYKKHNTCENVEAFVHHQVQLFWQQDRSITAKFLKLLYTDCMVTVCSLLFYTSTLL